MATLKVNISKVTNSLQQILIALLDTAKTVWIPSCTSEALELKLLLLLSSTLIALLWFFTIRIHVAGSLASACLSGRFCLEYRIFYNNIDILHSFYCTLFLVCTLTEVWYVSGGVREWY